MEIDEAVAPSKLSPAGSTFRMGNIYRSSFPSSKNATAGLSQAAKIHSKTRRSGSNPEKKSSEKEDLGSMTIEFLRARLIAERSTAKAAKIKAEDLQRKVHELERSLAIEIDRRKDAEAALQEALERLLHCSSSSESSGNNTESELEILSRAALSEDGRTRYSCDNVVTTPGSSMRREVALSEPGTEVPTVNSGEAVHEHTTGSLEVDTAVEGKVVVGAYNNGTVERHQTTLGNEESRTIHSDSDWASDEGKNQDSQVVASASSVNPALCLKSLDSDESDKNEAAEFKTKALRRSRVHLTEPKRSKHSSIRKKTRKRSEDEQEALSELTGWVNYVVNMLEARSHVNDQDQGGTAPVGSKLAPAAEPVNDAIDRLETSDSQKKTSNKLHKALSLRGEPYVSFAKYLGLKNLDELIELHRDKNGVMVWSIKSFPELQQTIQETREAGKLVDETPSNCRDKASSLKSASAISVKIPLQKDGDAKESGAESGVCRHHLNLQLDIGIKSIGTGTKEATEHRPERKTKEADAAPAANKGYDVDVSENNDFICMDISYKDDTEGSFRRIHDVSRKASDAVTPEEKLKSSGIINDETSGSVEQVSNKCQSKLLKKLGCFSNNQDKPVERTSSSRKQRSGEAESSRSIQSADEKIEEIFRALNAAKQQLKNSIERRHVIENELRSSRSSSCLLQPRSGTRQHT